MKPTWEMLTHREYVDQIHGLFSDLVERANDVLRKFYDRIIFWFDVVSIGHLQDDAPRLPIKSQVR